MTTLMGHVGTLPADAEMLRDNGFSYEYPGFWLHSRSDVELTISDGVVDDAWIVQIMSKDGHYLGGSESARLIDAIRFAKHY
jgi:hypothetical protein